MFQLQGASPPTDHGAAPRPRYASYQCTQQLNKIEIWPTQKIIVLCALALAPLTPWLQLQIPSAVHAQKKK